MSKSGMIPLCLKLVALAALAFVSVVAVRILVADSVPGFLSRAAEKIPLVKNYVVKDYSTAAFATVSLDSAILKVARYDVDFLASFTAKDGRYIAIFPYVVDATIRLDAVRRLPGKKAVVIPRPEYTPHLDADRARSSVFMNSLTLDYNTSVAPVLEAYLARSLDCARADSAFMDESMRKAESYIAALFPGDEIVWVDSTSGASADPVSRNSEHLPVRCVFSPEGTAVAFDRAASLRDDAIIVSSRFGNSERVPIRFGFSMHDRSNFDAFAKKFIAAGARDHVVFRYHDPVDPESSMFFSYADQGYRTAYLYQSGPCNVYYLDARLPDGLNDAYAIRHVAPNVLYLASGFKPSASSPSGAQAYAEYIESYERALVEVRAGRYGRNLGNAVLKMEQFADQRGGRDDDLCLYRKLLALSGGMYSPIRESGYRHTVAILEALAASDYSKLSSSIRLAGEEDLIGNGEANANLQALFWTMRDAIGIPVVEADAYRRDLVANGATVSTSLVNSLDPADRNILYANYFRNHLASDEAQSVWTDPDDDTETFYWYGEGAQIWLARHSPREMQNRLADFGSKRGTRFVVVFADPPSKSGFFTPYHVLVFDGYSVTAFRDATAWLRFSGKPERVPFSDVKTDLERGEFSSGDSTFRNVVPLARILARFHDAFSSPTWNRDELARLIRDGLVKDITETLSRPVPPFASSGGE